jgi:hypothetical protein
MSTVELRLTLSEETAQKLRDLALARHTSEAAIVEQALDLLSGPDEPPQTSDYWLSVATLREDWDTMPDDWITETQR